MKGTATVAIIVVAVILGRLSRSGEAILEYFHWKQRQTAPPEVEPPGLTAGTEFVYQVEPRAIDDDPAAITRATLIAQNVLSRRLKFFLGAEGFRVAIRGERLAVQVASEDEKTIRSVIEGAGAASFHLVARPEDQTDEQIEKAVADEGVYRVALRKHLVEGPVVAEGPYPSPPRRIARPMSTAKKKSYIDPAPKGNSLILLESGEEGMVPFGANLAAKVISYEKGKPLLRLTVPKALISRMVKLTGSNIGRSAAVVVDGTIVETVVIRRIIRGEGEMTLDFEDEELRRLAALLQGKLTVGLRLQSQSPLGKSESIDERRGR